MSSLKKVYVQHATLECECLNSLPNTVLDLQLDYVTIKLSCSCPTIKLPTHIQRLCLYSRSLENLVFLDASNIDELDDFHDLHISLSPSNNEYSAQPVRTLKIKLKSFVEKLSFGLRKLHISCLVSESGSWPSKDLSLGDNFVDHFELSNGAMESGNFNFSNIPSATFLDLSRFKTVSGQLSSTLESLDIDLEYYTKSFNELWMKFIEPSNLISLAIRFKSSQSRIDFTKLIFPVNIHNIHLFPRDNRFDIVMGELPHSLNYIQVCDRTIYNDEIINERRQYTDIVNSVKVIYPFSTLHFNGSDYMLSLY
ncbi:unnamed protein product [Ambrosiozyma monospora]|uniref:Unnamed protein product n=1 Tax=Ambrosiozyma monospora TaxID=43982 RepID=A0ACB5T7N3_AMBMO|nr:unnamed protein product [Ambrosiozyma monospora]